MTDNTTPVTETPAAGGEPVAVFHPYTTLEDPISDKPTEPGIGTVLGWLTPHGEPAVAVRAVSGWYLDRDEEPKPWHELLDAIGGPWSRVGVAVTWRPLIPEPDPTTD